jgi:hypothetical protein
MKYILTIMLAALLASCSRQASVRYEVLKLTTYPFGDPDPAPHPDGLFYPYFRFDGYARQGSPQEWKTVTMENEHIRLYIIPAIGGKIWGAVEKSSGEEFIYFNHAVKFRDVAMRGAWTSGGVEFNYGIFGHAPTTSTPVDYETRTNGDGSVSCFVGAFDLVSRTRWQVEINLPKDKAYFTTRTVWHNTTPASRPYYHWMNAGYRASDDLELCFPGQYYLGHDGDAHPWPADGQGRDLSKYARNDFGGYKSYHVMGQSNDFYAAYYRDSRFGSVHYTQFGDKQGMKIWIWGLSRQGMIWEDLLTDTDGQYVELQSGRLYNQAAAASQHTPFKQFAFEPYATDAWTEYWYPVKETGGIVKANQYGALNVRRGQADSVAIEFCPVQAINSDLVVKAGDRELFRKRLSLGVLQTWRETISCAGASAPLEVTLGDRLLVYSEDASGDRLSRPVATDPAFDPNTAYGLYVQGEQEMLGNRCEAAEQLLKRSLALEPFFVPALCDLGALYWRQGLYDRADSCARLALSVNTYDATANLLHGLACSRTGHAADARDGFAVAALSPSHRMAALICLAETWAKEANWQQTLYYTRRIRSMDVGQPEALQLQAVAYRKTGRAHEASDVTARLERYLPLNHYARFEKFMQSGSAADEKDFISHIRNELPHETLMEMAEWYGHIGCTDEALRLYAYNSAHPVALYRAAYMLFLKNDSACGAMLERAAAPSVRLVFPFRAESLPALEWAAGRDGHWKNSYYLGLLYAALRRPAEAADMLARCGTTPDDAVFYLARAEYVAGAEREADLLRAEQLEASWRTGRALINHYEQSAQYDKMYACTRKYAALFPDNDALNLKLAAAMIHREEYAACTELLAGLHILPYEGAGEGRTLYRNAWLFMALQNIRSGDCAAALAQIEHSKAWPENLGVGKPYDEDIDMRIEDAMSAHCYRMMNDAPHAAIHRERLQKSPFAGAWPSSKLAREVDNVCGKANF